jgi:flagellar biosynthesis protein FliQ
MIGSLVGVLRDGFLLALLLVAPVLVAALIAGILSGLLAAFTQIQDPSVALVPRVAAVGAAIALFAPAIASQLVTFANRIWPMIVAAGSG